MRTFIVSLAATLVFISTTQAQKIRWGLTGGPHSSIFLFGSEEANSNSSYFQKFGFHGGLIADLSMQPGFSIQPQLLFALKGGKLPNDAGFDFTAVDLPVNFLYRHQGFFAGAGPNFSYLLSGKIKTSGGETADLFNDESITDQIKVSRFEIGANVLLGYEFPGGFLLSANYAAGINSIFKTVDNPSDVTLLAHNSYFGFSIGYMFQSKSK
jgi:hypothetical protein